MCVLERYAYMIRACVVGLMPIPAHQNSNVEVSKQRGTLKRWHELRPGYADCHSRVATLEEHQSPAYPLLQQVTSAPIHHDAIRVAGIQTMARLYLSLSCFFNDMYHILNSHTARAFFHLIVIVMVVYAKVNFDDVHT